MTALFVARLDGIFGWLRSLSIQRSFVAAIAIALTIVDPIGKPKRIKPSDEVGRVISGAPNDTVFAATGVGSIETDFAEAIVIQPIGTP